MKRVFLLIATNIAIMVVLSIAASVLGLDRILTENGLNLPALLGLSALFGFGGAFISLLISKPMAKWSTGARVIDGSEGSTEYGLVETVRRLSQKAGIGMPEVAVYDGEPNAFAAVDDASAGGVQRLVRHLGDGGTFHADEAVLEQGAGSGVQHIGMFENDHGVGS